MQKSQTCFGDGGRKLHTTNRTIGFSQAHIGRESNRIGRDRFILALLTRETPAAIAIERKSLQKILENVLSKADEVEKRMAAYTSRLESRIAQLPKELETGLDPPRIAKLLGESLRQCFQQSGLQDTARALDQSCSEMKSVQTQLVNVIREVAHPDIGVIAKVRSANESLFRSMTARAQQIDDLLGRLEKQVWVIWLSNEKLIHILKQQVPDRGRHNMRYFGLLSPRSKARTWAVLFALLGQKKGSHPRRLSWRWLRLKTFGTDPLQDSLGRPMHWVGRRTPVKAA